MSRLTNRILILASVFCLCFNILVSFLCHEQRLVKYKSIYNHQYIRSTFSNPFKIVSNSLSLNKFAFLTARDSFPTHEYIYDTTWKGGRNIVGKTTSSVTEQLNSGVRAFILKIFDGPNNTGGVFVGIKGETFIYSGNNWYDSFTPALGILKEIEEFLSSNPFEILTLIFQDCVSASNGLAKVFEDARLSKFVLPLKKMPRCGGDWPLVKDMIAANQRLIVFTSNMSKEETEGMAYTWNFMVECKYGSQKRIETPCTKNKLLSSATDDTKKSLVLLSFYSSPRYGKDLMNAINRCYVAASNRWPNFIAVDNDQDLGARQANYFLDFLNGKLLCECDDVNSCQGSMLWPLKTGLNNLCWGRRVSYELCYEQRQFAEILAETNVFGPISGSQKNLEKYP